MRLVIALLVFAAYGAQTPRITLEQRARFWRAQAELLVAQARAEKAMAAVQAIQAEMSKACESPVTLDLAGEPACAPPADAKGEN